MFACKKKVTYICNYFYTLFAGKIKIMAKEDKIYRCQYTNVKCDRIFEIDIFGVYSSNDKTFGNINTAENTIILPHSTISVINIDDGQYEIPFGMPDNSMHAEILIDISLLDIERNTDHKNFVELVMLPNKCKLKPCVVIKEHYTDYLEEGGNDMQGNITQGDDTQANITFIGKIDKGIASGLGLDQKQITLKVEHLICYILRNIQVPNYSTLPNNTSVVDIFTYITEAEEYKNKIRQHDSPFAFYWHKFTSGSNSSWPQRTALLYMVEPIEEPKEEINRYRDKNRLNYKKGTNQIIHADNPNYPNGAPTEAIGWLDKVYIYDLGYSNLYYVNLSDMFNCLGEIVKKEYKKHCRNYLPIGDFQLSNIFSQIKYYKQTYNGSSEKGNPLSIEDLYIIKRTQLFHKQTGFSFKRLVKDCRWNNVFDVLETLALANLCKVEIYPNDIIFSNGKTTQNNEVININPSLQPVEISDIQVNMNPLDNLDVVYLEHTDDDITNQQNAMTGANNTDKCTTIQLVWHNQIPNNAKGWSSNSNSKESMVTLTTNPNKYGRWFYWGSRQKNINGGYRRIDKAANYFVYLLWYIEEAGIPEGMMARRKLPYLVHFDTKLALKNLDLAKVSESVSKVQITGCLHNQIVDKIREDWYSNEQANIPHYELTLKIPIVMWEQFIQDRASNAQMLTHHINKMVYKINITTAWGHNLSISDKWFVIGCTRNFADGTFELKLINDR